MNREQFIAQLARLLQDLPPAERQEAIRYYQEYFDDAGEENEDAVIQELGSPGKVAASIKANLQYGGSTFGANDTDMENTGTESQTKDADGWQQNGQTMNRWNQSTQQGWQNSSTQSPYAMQARKPNTDSCSQISELLILQSFLVCYFNWEDLKIRHNSFTISFNSCFSSGYRSPVLFTFLAI